MKPGLAILIFAAACKSGAPSPQTCPTTPAVAATPAAMPAAVPTDPRQQTVRQRIEGVWSFEKWFRRQENTLAPEIGGIFSLTGGIATFQLNFTKFHTHVYCIGYYKFSDDDTVLTIGWNHCAKFRGDRELKEGQYVGDFTDEWDGVVPQLAIAKEPNGDLSLKYNTNNEHGRVVKHGGFGWDMTFRTDETLEYWNMSEFEGKKDNVKVFRKLHGGDPKLAF